MRSTKTYLIAIALGLVVLLGGAGVRYATTAGVSGGSDQQPAAQSIDAVSGGSGSGGFGE